MSVMSNPDTKASITMQGVDTIVAMPQWYINLNLDSLLKNGSTIEGKSLKDVKLTYASGTSWLKGKVDRLWTQVYVHDSTTKVVFALAFEEGTMDYFDVTVAPPVSRSADIKGLEFGFDVDLSIESVQHEANLPQDVKDRLKDLLNYLGPGAFSIQHLFMDLENAALGQYDPRVTKFPPTMPTAATSAFPNYLAQYVAQLKNAGGNTLGYAIKVSDTADLPTSFPPASLRLVTNQYRGGPDGETLNSDLDTVNYLMMTGSRTFPSNPAPWWGNLVVPSDKPNGWYGTMAMANGLFVKQFLLTRLAPLVLKHWVFGHNEGSLLPNYRVESGTFTATELGGKWISGTETGSSHRTNTLSNDDIDYSMTVSVDLSVTPGANTVVITRNTDFDIHYTHWYGLEGKALSTDFHVWYRVPLTITIKLQGVMDGKLQIDVSQTTNEPNPETPYGDPYGWDIVRCEGSYSIWKGINDDMDLAIDAIMKLAMPQALLDDVSEEIKGNLNLAPFVFPGSAQLFFANPQFDNAGDLLLGLQYKV